MRFEKTFLLAAHPSYVVGAAIGLVVGVVAGEAVGERDRDDFGGGQIRRVLVRLRR